MSLLRILGEAFVVVGDPVHNGLAVAAFHLLGKGADFLGARAPELWIIDQFAIRHCRSGYLNVDCGVHDETCSQHSIKYAITASRRNESAPAAERASFGTVKVKLTRMLHSYRISENMWGK
jgi:hypothetical protein